MKERPILFSGPMVRALLENRKTQTRRLALPNQPIPDSFDCFELRHDPVFGTWRLGPSGATMVPFFQAAYGWVNGAFGVCRYGVPGDRLWVREGIRWSPEHDNFYFIADSKGVGTERYLRLRPKAKSCPAIHMPRDCSRITLEVTGVRVERLQKISDADARAEGLDLAQTGAAPERFAELWDQINGKRASWASNPWVWVVEFKPLPTSSGH